MDASAEPSVQRYAAEDLREVVAGALAREGHLLAAGEVVVARRILTLDDEACELYARLTMRVGRVFRVVDLDYALDTSAAVARLVAEELADGFAPDDACREAVGVPELRAACRALGLAVGGNRDALEARLAGRRWMRDAVVVPRHRALLRRLELLHFQRSGMERGMLVAERQGFVRWADYTPTGGPGLFPTRAAMRERERAVRGAWSDPGEPLRIALGGARDPGPCAWRRAVEAVVATDPPAEVLRDLVGAGARLWPRWALRLEAEGRVAEALEVCRGVVPRDQGAEGGPAPLRNASPAVPADLVGGKAPQTHDLSPRERETPTGPGALRGPQPPPQDASPWQKPTSTVASGSPLGVTPAPTAEERVALHRTGRRIAKKLRRSWPPEVAPDIPVRRVQLARGGDVGARPGWRGDDRDRVVEAAVLSLPGMRARGAIHAENALWTSLYALVLRDLYWLPVPGMLPGPRRSGPRDVGTPGFARRRREAVDARLAEVAESGTRSFVDAWSGERLDGLVPAPELLAAARSVPGDLARAVLTRLVDEGWEAARGLPDLWIPPGARVAVPEFLPATLPESGLLAEVKGPSDSIRDAQAVWMRHLVESKILVEVWSVA